MRYGIDAHHETAESRPLTSPRDIYRIMGYTSYSNTYSRPGIIRLEQEMSLVCHIVEDAQSGSLPLVVIGTRAHIIGNARRAELEAQQPD